MRAKELFEKRKSEKKPALVQLEQYVGQGDIHVSFTALDKVGINPDQTEAAGTPYGIYAYNLDAVFQGMQEGGSASNVPTAGDHPYIFVLQETSGDFISNPSAYTDALFRQDLKKMKGFYAKHAEPRDYIYMGAELAISHDKPFSKLMKMTKTAASDAASKTGKKIPLMWNAAFRFLGYSGIADNGTGAIHPKEPIQTIFFEKKAFKVVDKILNTEYDQGTDRISKELSPSKDQKAQKQADRERFDQQRMDRFEKDKEKRG